MDGTENSEQHGNKLRQLLGRLVDATHSASVECLETYHSALQQCIYQHRHSQDKTQLVKVRLGCLQAVRLVLTAARARNWSESKRDAGGGVRPFITRASFPARAAFSKNETESLGRACGQAKVARPELRPAPKWLTHYALASMPFSIFRLFTVIPDC